MPIFMVQIKPLILVKYLLCLAAVVVVCLNADAQLKLKKKLEKKLIRRSINFFSKRRRKIVKILMLPMMFLGVVMSLLPDHPAAVLMTTMNRSL